MMLSAIFILYSRDAVTCPVAFDLIHKWVTLKSYIKLYTVKWGDIAHFRNYLANNVVQVATRLLQWRFKDGEKCGEHVGRD